MFASTTTRLRFHRLYQRLKDFCIVDLSAIYFDVLKDRLYTSAPKSLARRSAQTALWRLGDALVRLLAPVMSFTSEEVWGFLPAMHGQAGECAPRRSSLLPQDLTGELPAGFDVAAIEGDWQTLLSVRDEALKALEAARAEKRSAAAWRRRFGWPLRKASIPCWIAIAISCAICLSFRTSCWRNLPASNGDTGLTIAVGKAPGQKCERCWNYSIHVGEDKNYPTVCERCSAVLAEIEATAAEPRVRLQDRGFCCFFPRGGSV